MFGLFDMMFMDSHEDRLISNTVTSDPEGNSIEIDTCRVNDSGEFTSETAINRNNGNWVVVQCYKDDDEAALAHINRVKLAENGKIPEDIEDQGQNFWAILVREFSTIKLPDGNIIENGE